MKPKSVIIIGAGIGGLLRRSIWQNTVTSHRYREELQPAGAATNSTGRSSLRHRPTCWSCPSSLAEFELGTSMFEWLDLKRVDPTYHLVFDDGSQLALTSDMKVLQEQLEAIEPGSFQGFLRYLDEGCRHYSKSIDKLVYPDFRKPTDFFKLSNLPLLYEVKPLAKHYANLSHFFTNPRLKAASLQDVYRG
jgi:phytoene dehydrogenase-like protein